MFTDLKHALYQPRGQDLSTNLAPDRFTNQAQNIPMTNEFVINVTPENPTGGVPQGGIEPLTINN
jgi:hypothetical protein